MCWIYVDSMYKFSMPQNTALLTLHCPQILPNNFTYHSNQYKPENNLMVKF